MLNHSPLTCVRVSPLFPGNIFQNSKFNQWMTDFFGAISSLKAKMETILGGLFDKFFTVYEGAKMEAPGYLDLRELGRVVLHGAHYLVSEFLFIVIPQQIFTLKKPKTKKTFCYQNTGMFDAETRRSCQGLTVTHATKKKTSLSL